MLPIEHQNYAVMLRDKTAEFSALKALDAPNKEFILPIVVAASFFVKDQEKKRQLTLNNLSDTGLRTKIHSLLLKMVVKPQQCVLILDFSDADLANVEAFAGFEAEWILRAQEFGLWRRVIVAATNYPEKNPAAENDQARVGRKEWLAWKHALSLNSRVGELGMFGDFGADNARIDFGTAGRALKHIRYATRDEWLVVRGGGVTPKCDGSIRDVAQRILLSGSFCRRALFSGR